MLCFIRTDKQRGANVTLFEDFIAVIIYNYKDFVTKPPLEALFQTIRPFIELAR